MTGTADADTLWPEAAMLAHLDPDGPTGVGVPGPGIGLSRLELQMPSAGT